MVIHLVGLSPRSMVYLPPSILLPTQALALYSILTRGMDWEVFPHLKWELFPDHS